MKKTLLIIAAALMAFSCDKQDPVVEYELAATPTELEFSADGNSLTVNLTSNGKWATSTADSWLTISPKEGEGNATLTITAAANETEKVRKGSFSVNGPSKKITVSVQQKAPEKEGPEPETKISEIKTADDWKTFSAQLEAEKFAATETVKLAADITVTEPIAALTCNFDGQNHTITMDLEEKEPYTAEDLKNQCVGVFRKVVGVTVKNLKTAGSIKSCPPDNENGAEYTYYIGGICGWAEGAAVIDGCTNGINISATAFNTQHMGGICGHALGEVTVTGCTNKGSVAFEHHGKESKASQIGGICGHCADNANIVSCTNDGAITYDGAGTARMAGIVGYTNNVVNGLYKDCTNNGTIKNDATGYSTNKWAYVGGITGYFGTPTEGCKVNYEGCVNNGEITSETGGSQLRTRLGGIAALAGNSSGFYTYKNCANNGNITQTGGDNTGTRAQLAGIVAYAEVVATVAVDGSSNNAALTTDAAGVKNVGLGGIIGGGALETSSFTNVIVGAKTVITMLPGATAGLIGGANSAYATAVSGKVAGKIIAGDTVNEANAGNFAGMLFGRDLGGSKDVSGVSFNQ